MNSPIEHCNDLNSDNIRILAKNLVSFSKDVISNGNNKQFHTLMFAIPSLPTKDESTYLQTLTSLACKEQLPDDAMETTHEQESDQLRDDALKADIVQDLADSVHEKLEVGADTVNPVAAELSSTQESQLRRINPYEKWHYFSNIAFLGTDDSEMCSTRRLIASELLSINITNIMHVFNNTFWLPSRQFVPIANDTLRYSCGREKLMAISERILLRYFQRLLLIQEEYDQVVREYGKSEGSNMQFASVSGRLSKLLDLQNNSLSTNRTGKVQLFDYPKYLNEVDDTIDNAEFEEDDLSELLNRDLPDRYLIPKPHLPIRLPQSDHGQYVVTIFVPNLMTILQKSHTASRAEKLMTKYFSDCDWIIDPLIAESDDPIDTESINFVGVMNVLDVFDDIHSASVFAKTARDEFSNLFDIQVAQFSGKTLRYPRLSALLSSIDSSSVENSITIPHELNAQ